jgi:hypothetical protein
LARGGVILRRVAVQSGGCGLDRRVGVGGGRHGDSCGGRRDRVESLTGPPRGWVWRTS